MAKSTKKSNFEQDSKAVLETVLTSDAKARVRREMSLNKRQAAGDVLPFPNDADKPAPGTQEKSSEPKKRKAVSKKGKLTLAELNNRLERFMEESQRREQERQTDADALPERLNAMHAGLNNMEQTMQTMLSRSEEDRNELRALSASAANLHQQLEITRLAVAEKPWEQTQASMESMLQKLADRVQRLESGPPLPAVMQPSVPAVVAAPAADAQKPVRAAQAQPTAQEWLEKAKAYWSKGRYSDAKAAMTCLDKALALVPHDAQYLNERGLAKVDAGLLREALTDFTKALEASPQMAAAYHNRGLVYVQLNIAQKACADFQRAAALGDDRAWRKARESGYCGGSVFKKLLRGIID